MIITTKIDWEIGYSERFRASTALCKTGKLNTLYFKGFLSLYNDAGTPLLKETEELKKDYPSVWEALVRVYEEHHTGAEVKEAPSRPPARTRREDMDALMKKDTACQERIAVALEGILGELSKRRHNTRRRVLDGQE